ncbi:MAG: hydrogenase maturation nickel metallochaperone HypA [Deltaproteobacteria bacterium]|nr:hydrogenase maturation nickel metallochaperone HypA [Deltaproteobacteria bacterium]
MHELGLTQDLVDLVTAKAVAEGVAKVISVRLMVGEFAGVEPDSVSFCFEVVSRGTVAENARLEIERVPGREFRVVSMEVD